jgi:hypothetical protein
VVGAAAVLAVLSALGLAARSGVTTAGAAGGRIARLHAPVTGAASGGVVDGIGAGGEQVAFHIHAHLAVFVNGRRRTIPYGIGVVPPLRLEATTDGPFVADGAAFYWLHTHDTSGVIHVESPVLRSYTLGEFFDIWGEPLGKTQVGPDRGPVTALVDGTPFGGDPRDIPLGRHAVLQLDVGAAVPFRPNRFPAGL